MRFVLSLPLSFKMKRRTQIRIDDDRIKLAKKIRAEIRQQTGRDLSLALVVSMAVGIGLPHVKKAFLTQ